MLNLYQHLERLPHRDLRAIATHLAVRRRGQHRKADWVEAVCQVWQDRTRREKLLATLSPAAQRALHRLYRAGAMPAPPFFAEYGRIRRATPGEHWSPPPWERPANPSEELFYIGLLAGEQRGNITATPRLTLPADLVVFLEHRWFNPADSISSEAHTVTPTPLVLLHDVEQALIYLCKHPELATDPAPTTPGQHRWLPVRHLAALNNRLLRLEPVPLPASHKRTTRLRFLFFLLRAASFVDRMAPMPAAWAWLALPTPVRRLASLWDAWLNADSTTRAAYGQPEARLPAPWPRPLFHILPEPDTIFTAPLLSDLVLGQTTELQDYFTAHLPNLYMLDHLIEEMLRGPLTAFGAVISAPAAARSGPAGCAGPPEAKSHPSTKCKPLRG